MGEPSKAAIIRDILFLSIFFIAGVLVAYLISLEMVTLSPPRSNQTINTQVVTPVQAASKK